jgi:hypothetical protein
VSDAWFIDHCFVLTRCIETSYDIKSILFVVFSDEFVASALSSTVYMMIILRLSLFCLELFVKGILSSMSDMFAPDLWCRMTSVTD